MPTSAHHDALQPIDVPGMIEFLRDLVRTRSVHEPGKWIAHQADEFVEISDVTTCARVYASAALRFLTGAARRRSAA